MEEGLPVKETNLDRLIGCLSDFDTIKEAAIHAGYSEVTATKYVYTILKRPKVQDRIREYYKINNLGLLPKILKAESKLVDLVLKDPEKLSKHNNTIKQIKQVAGVLESDDAPKTQFINVLNLRDLSIQVLNKQEEPKTIEAEVIND